MEWRPGVVENLNYYVYLLVDPRDDCIFYVGKGVGERCFSHVREARGTSQDSIGDYEKLATIRDITESGFEVGIEILRHALTEEEAFHVEAAAIDFAGFLGYSVTNRVFGHGAASQGRMTVDEINARYGARRVEFDPEHRLILIRSRRFTREMDDNDLYKRRGNGGDSDRREPVPITLWRCIAGWSERSTRSTVGSTRQRPTLPKLPIE